MRLLINRYKRFKVTTLVRSLAYLRWLCSNKTHSQTFIVLMKNVEAWEPDKKSLMQKWKHGID